MEYRAVKNRCAVILRSLHLPISNDDALSVLDKKGFRIINIDPVALARQCMGRSQYRRGSRPSEAPAIVDCSSFIKWLYGERGIWLPRRSIQQRELGDAIGFNDLVAGDVVFVSGCIDYYYDDPADGVGHVGVYSGAGTVIHAANKKDNVMESPLNEFVGKDKFRGARRYIPAGDEAITFEMPRDREVETADDIRWIILQSLSKTK